MLQLSQNSEDMVQEVGSERNPFHKLVTFGIGLVTASVITAMALSKNDVTNSKQDSSSVNKKELVAAPTGP